MVKTRIAKKIRKTKETSIKLTLNIDGEGKADIDTKIPFLNHMLELFTYWGLFDLEIKAEGDLEVGIHHTNEDIGICLGEAFKEALGDKKGIRRIGFAAVPMDEALAQVTLDISGRSSLNFETFMPSRLSWNDLTGVEQFIENLKSEEKYTFEDAKHFLQSFANNCGINIHITLKPTSDLHHTLEAIFKALGIALDKATQIDPRRKGVPSTKGKI
ncbi:MAG: imidazoleglycerol-phosphate dehydratase [Candidatus Omnitrophica bacterium]|nr:imidazoleglycerol-phosphate dehydratase [Candidatus Omnitrophota bacterium]